MKKRLKTRWGLFLAIGLVFWAAQTVQAQRPDAFCNGSATGEITEINLTDNTIKINIFPFITFYGIPVESIRNYLEDCIDCTLDEGVTVTIDFHVCPDVLPLEEGEGEITTAKACSIQIVGCPCACDTDDEYCTFELLMRHGGGNVIPPYPPAEDPLKAGPAMGGGEEAPHQGGNGAGAGAGPGR